MDEIWQKLLAVVLGAALGYVIPVLTYEQRIASLEKFEDSTSSDRFRKQDAELLLKDIELELERIRADIRSNRTFVRRECFRNNHQDSSAGNTPINNCDQDF
jgi:hypothetical protein